MSSYTAAERRKILKDARATLAAAPSPYVPKPEPVFYKTHEIDRELEPERERAPRLDTAPIDWAAWDAWLADRIDAALQVERAAMLQAIAKIVGASLGNALADTVEIERARTQREIHELRVEAARLNSAVESLHSMLSAERSKVVLDLPPLPLRRDVN